MSIRYRIEGDPHHDTAAEGLSAQLHDPLWMLGRQWQLGEFRASDGGSPVLVEVAHHACRVDQVQYGTATATAVDLGAVPLEALIEREPGGAAVDWWLRIRAGAHWIELARAANLPNATTSLFSLPSSVAGDAEATGLLSRYRLSCPDGDKIQRAIDDGTLATKLGVAVADRPRLDALATTWRAWYAPRAGLAPSGYQPERMESSATLSAPTEDGRWLLEAKEHAGGHLDWDAFSARLPTPASTPAPTTTAAKYLPSPVTFPGMPATRFWEMEDARVDLGSIPAGAGDAGRLVLIEFALMWANDWFVVPVPTPTGALIKIESLVVTDTFGVKSSIGRARNPHTDDPNFQLFRQTVSGSSFNLNTWLFVPPTLPGSMESQVVEEIVIVRDDGANLAWAMERQVSDPLGRLLPRAAPGAQPPPPPPTLGAPDADERGSTLRYQPMTPVRDGWFPLAVIHDGQGGRFLERADVVDGSATVSTPKGAILAGTFRVRDDEVPREGVVLRRRYQLARASDGSMHLWVTREKQPAVLEADSGLRFDALTELLREPA